MPGIELRLADWARRATPAERRAGPTIENLGGVRPDEARQLATGPFLVYLIQAAAHQQRTGLVDDAQPLRAAVLTGLLEQQRHSAFASATDVLTRHPDFARALGAGLPRALLARLNAMYDAGDEPAPALIAAEAADCLARLTLAGVTRAAQLLGALDSATEDVAALPEPFAARLPRLLGLLEAHHPGTGLREALERLLPLDHTCRDAAFELALTDLQDALQASNATTMTAGLVCVRRRLAELLAQTSERLDARIYHDAIDAVLTLAGPEATTRIPALAASLHTTLQKYRAWRHNTHLPTWSRSSCDDITAWAELTAVLDAAARHVGEDDPWYDDGQAILMTLLTAYGADRTVTVVKERSIASVVEVLVAPAIEDVFLRSDNRIRFLEHAVENDPLLRAEPAAVRLLGSLRDRSRSPAVPDGHPDGGGLGKVRRWPLVGQTVTPAEFTQLTETAPEQVLDRLELALRTHEDTHAAAMDPKLGRLMDRLVGQLQQSPDWIPDIADPFHVLLNTTVRYAFLCYDIGRKMGGSYTEYLRLRDASKKKQKVDEALFHQHFYEVLCFSSLFRIIDAEVIEHAGGRVDIRASFGPVRFNVECKIEEHDASEAALRHYAAQAIEYQNTNAAFAILLVLDKTEHAEGTVNLFESIWVEQVQRNGESSPCRVVTIRVPGGRDDPSSLRAPDRRT
ncbi:hypothetical protein [Krasilnikovia sp. MM14-A1004]|uniref:hypothetical protein n=1 Tax=Krasilnikovia sp. MM14-A1004 TaxID=3373541 RepID=UPI00399D061D